MEYNFEDVKARFNAIMDEQDILNRTKLLQHFMEDGMLSYLMGIAIAVEENKENEVDFEEKGFPMTFPSSEAMFWSKKRFTYEYQGETYTFDLCPEDMSTSGTGTKNGIEFTHFIKGPRIEAEGHEYVIVMIIEGENEYEAYFAFGTPVVGTDTGDETMYNTLEISGFSDFLANLYASANKDLS